MIVSEALTDSPKDKKRSFCFVLCTLNRTFAKETT